MKSFLIMEGFMTPTLGTTDLHDPRSGASLMLFLHPLVFKGSSFEFQELINTSSETQIVTKVSEEQLWGFSNPRA